MWMANVPLLVRIMIISYLRCVQRGEFPELSPWSVVSAGDTRGGWCEKALHPAQWPLSVWGLTEHQTEPALIKQIRVGREGGVGV